MHRIVITTTKKEPIILMARSMSEAIKFISDVEKEHTVTDYEIYSGSFVVNRKRL
jgi:hypothetical protein